jgi:hypothetical protein
VRVTHRIRTIEQEGKDPKTTLSSPVPLSFPVSEERSNKHRRPLKNSRADRFALALTKEAILYDDMGAELWTGLMAPLS